MSKVVYKYALEISDHSQIELPKGARVLSIKDNPGNDRALLVWAIHDESVSMLPPEVRQFRIAGTGHPVDGLPEHSRFIDTVRCESQLVWHVWEICA